MNRGARVSAAAILAGAACLSVSCGHAPERDTPPAPTPPPAAANARWAATPSSVNAPPSGPDSARFLGSFDNFVFTEEHQYGYDASLYLLGDSLVGTFSHSEGLIGDTPTGLLEAGSYEAGSGALRFRAKLSIGTTWDDERRTVPSRDLYTFEGMLAGDSLTGVVEWRDMLHTRKTFTERDTVTLMRRGTDAERAAQSRSREDWERSIRSIGPKW